jgi:hypothetical protein
MMLAPRRVMIIPLFQLPSVRLDRRTDHGAVFAPHRGYHPFGLYYVSDLTQQCCAFNRSSAVLSDPYLFTDASNVPLREIARRAVACRDIVLSGQLR